MKDLTKKMLAQHLGISEEKIKDETRIVEDLGFDSLDTVELLMGLEEEFGISIPDEDAMKLKTLGDVANYVEKIK